MKKYSVMKHEQYILYINTLQTEEAREKKETKIIYWELYNINDFNFLNGSDGDELFKEICKLKYENFRKNIYLFVEDLNFYTPFLINIFKFTDKEKIEHNEIITENGVIYNLTFYLYGKKIVFYNLKVKGIMSLEQAAEIAGYNITSEIKKSKIYGAALKELFDLGLKSTSASNDAFNKLKEYSFGYKEFEKFHPTKKILEDENYKNFINSSIQGGFCFLNNKYKNIEIKEGYGFDVNAEYPAMMTKKEYRLPYENKVFINYYPYGDGIYFYGKYEYDEIRPLYIQHIIIKAYLKNKKLPVIMMNNRRTSKIKDFNFGFKNSYLYDTEELSLNDGTLELFVNNIDMEEIKRNYYIESIKYIDGYKFGSMAGCYDSFYINFYNRRMIAKKENNLKKSSILKLLLDSSTGKFAQIADVKSKNIKENNGICEIELNDEESKIKQNYLPTASFLYAYARRYIRRWSEFFEDDFIYADTDSIYIQTKTKRAKERIKFLNISENLGDFKIEHHFERAKFLQKKSYCLYSKEEGYIIKFSGMTSYTKNFLQDEMNEGRIKFKDYKPGLTIKAHELRPVKVKGGVLYYPFDFTIKSDQITM